jgi:hypothetical protein
VIAIRLKTLLIPERFDEEKKLQNCPT